MRRMRMSFFPTTILKILCKTWTAEVIKLNFFNFSFVEMRSFSYFSCFVEFVPHAGWLALASFCFSFFKRLFHYSTLNTPITPIVLRPPIVLRRPTSQLQLIDKDRSCSSYIRNELFERKKRKLSLRKQNFCILLFSKLPIAGAIMKIAWININSKSPSINSMLFSASFWIVSESCTNCQYITGTKCLIIGKKTQTAAIFSIHDWFEIICIILFLFSEISSLLSEFVNGTEIIHSASKCKF